MDQFLAEIGMRERDQRLGALPGGSAREIGRAVFRGDIEDLAARRGDDVAAEARQDARMAHACLVDKAGGHAEEGKAVLRRRRAVDKVKLAAGAADLAGTDTLRADLAVEVGRQAAVDRDHRIILGNDRG